MFKLSSHLFDKSRASLCVINPLNMWMRNTHQPYVWCIAEAFFFLKKGIKFKIQNLNLKLKKCKPCMWGEIIPSVWKVYMNREKKSIVRVTEHWNSLLRFSMDSSFLLRLVTRTRLSLEVPSTLNHHLILWMAAAFLSIFPDSSWLWGENEGNKY